MSVSNRSSSTFLLFGEEEMRVYDIVRKRFGDNDDEFVDYPVTSHNKDWTDVKIYKDQDKKEGMTLHGVLLEEREEYSVFSCGGFLAYCKNNGTVQTEIYISVVPIF